jgi:hypothetical protein
MQRGEPVVVFIHFLMEQQISAPSGSARYLSRANSHHDVSSLREKTVLAFLFRWNCRPTAGVESAQYQYSYSGAPPLTAALELAGDLLHYRVAGFVSGARRKRLLMCHDGTRGFVQAQQLPANRFVARATAADLPNSHNGVVFLGEANSVDLDRSGVAVIAKFKNMA